MIPSDFPSHTKYLEYIEQCEQAWLEQETSRGDILTTPTWRQMFQLDKPRYLCEDLDRVKALHCYDFASNHIQPLFKLKNDHPRESTSGCYTCNPCPVQGGEKEFWERFKSYWNNQQSDFQTDYKPELAATRSHP